jgi:hypothetical protein
MSLPSKVTEAVDNAAGDMVVAVKVNPMPMHGLSSLKKKSTR